MSTATIISNIQKLPLAEQHFVVEQVMKSIRNVEQKQTGFAEIPEGYMTGDEFARRVKSELKQLYLENGLLQ
ncbi:MAG: hypothetical protein FWD60_00990 [Candidatus Azobacteroides sp.]|nr:hypothetical protein [Candidatus Azobacteroides sp.]